MSKWLCLFALIMGPAAILKSELAANENSVNALQANAANVAAEPEVAKNEAPKDIPEKVMKVLAYVDDKGEAMSGYEGGRTFGNFEKELPEKDGKGRRIKYREWDVNRLRPGVNRGPERLITGSDGSAYYTKDHYKTFKKIR